jgi:hypothetical protein
MTNELKEASAALAVANSALLKALDGLERAATQEAVRRIAVGDLGAEDAERLADEAAYTYASVSGSLGLNLMAEAAEELAKLTSK